MNSLRYISKHPYISLVETCTTLIHIKQVHSQLLTNGLLNEPVILGHFVSSIARKHPDNLHYSCLLLERCDKPTVFALNSMMRVYSKTSTPEKSFHFFKRILQSSENLAPDNYSFTFLVRASAQLLDMNAGFAVHAIGMTYGFQQDLHVRSGLVHMYAELGLIGFSQRLFMEISEPDLVTQTAMVNACAKSGDIHFARYLFDKMPQRDPVAWNAMISGYAQCGEPREALNLFHSMQMEGVMVNDVSIVSVLSACTHLGALDRGRWAHAYIETNRIRMTVYVGTALIDMYAKCGDINKAMEVFWGMKEKNVYTWSSAMGGLAMNGLGSKCLELFSLMKREGVQPNEVTFVSVLRGCSVVGLVDEGQQHFDSMRSVYGLEPKSEHYGCLVDLYGRAGRLDDALNIINTMPIKPHAGAWGALLNACKIYRNMEMGELASRKIVELESNNDGAYVLLSNIYADSKNWDKVDNVRMTMNNRGVIKVPGCSVIEEDNYVHCFI